MDRPATATESRHSCVGVQKKRQQTASPRRRADGTSITAGNAPRSSNIVALTGNFRDTVYKRAQRDSGFRKALLTEAMNAYLCGDESTERQFCET